MPRIPDSTCKIFPDSLTCSELVGILQSRKTMVLRSDLRFSKIALRGWKDKFGNDSPFSLGLPNLNMKEETK